MTGPTVVIGVGNRMRGDDAAGPEVARRLGRRRPELEAVEHETEPSGLLELWAGAGLAIVVDSLGPGGAPGRVARFDAGAEPLPARSTRSASTHAVDLAEAIELARSLGRLPGRLVVYGIEGERFDAGAPLTPAVERAVAGLVEELAAATSNQ